MNRTSNLSSLHRRAGLGLACAGTLWMFAAGAVARAEVVLTPKVGGIAPVVVERPIDLPALSAREQRALSPAAREQRRQDELLKTIAEDLVYHLGKMTGTRPEIIVAGEAQPPRPAIVLGAPAVKLGAVPAFETPTQESFRLLTRDGRVLIGGESVYGVAHGVYEWLRELGCDWIFPGEEGEVIPARARLAVGELDVARKPVFEVRSPWYSGGARIVNADEQAQFAQWKIRQQQTAYRDRPHPTFLGGGHYWASLIGRNRKFLEENPDLRALTRQPDGSLERTWSQLDAAHTGVVELTVQDIRQTFERNGWPKDYPVAMSIGPNDGGGYSVSPEALAAGAGRNDPVTGDQDQTDALVLYANRVLERLVPEYPNLYLGFYLYSVHADYPMRHKPHPHLALNIADITYSRFHSLLDKRSVTRTYYRGILEQWARLNREQGNPLSFYGYNWNLAENLMPYSKMKIWGEDLPYYAAMGVVGHNNEQDKAWSILGPHNYLMARMGWDTSLDWRQVLAHYCTLAFGAGAEPMEQYYLDLIDTQESAGFEAGGYASIHLIFDRGFVERARARFARAAAAAGTEVHRRNVDYFSQPVTALERYLDYRDAVTAFDFEKGLRAYEAMLAHWETYLEKNANLVSRYGRRYAENWLFGPYVKQAHQYSTGDYRLLHALPDALPTLLDPNVSGAFMGFQNPEVRDHSWMTTKTWSSSWEAQGLGPYRQGAVWYRQRFELPKTGEGEGIGLFIGAVEDEIHVWCNGQYVGRGRGFIRPFAFDLTAHVRPGGDNLLALQVVRRGMLNELWQGGLLYPSFVFAGPRLDQPAPLDDPPYRVLPGGAREPIRP